MKKQPFGCCILLGHTFSFLLSTSVMKRNAANKNKPIASGDCDRRYVPLIAVRKIPLATAKINFTAMLLPAQAM
ncbi:hypothetical protein [Pseudomonas orientalis]|uniref:hypothetical protein n=1 Tax=Pseudomonas orientalis TaxID=76758 RepID=UPI0013000B8E|nr:hypothetical protein [Pseudomonas orientalis]